MNQKIYIKCEKDDFVYESCSQGFKQESLNNKGNYGVTYEETDKNVKMDNNKRFIDNEAFGCIVKVETIENHQFSLEDNTDESIHRHGKPLTNHNNFNSAVLHSQRLNDSGSGEEKDNVVSSITKEEVDSCEDGEDETGLNKQILDTIHKIDIEDNDITAKPLINIHNDNLNNENNYNQVLNVLSSEELTNHNTEVYYKSFNLNTKYTALKTVNDTVTSMPDLFQLESKPVIHINQAQINKELNKINSEGETTNLNIKKEKDYNEKDNSLDAKISSLKCGLCYKVFMDEIAYNSHMTLLHIKVDEQLTENKSIDINAANQNNEKSYNKANSNLHIVPTPKAATTKPLKQCNKVTKHKKQSGRKTNKEHNPLNVNEGVYTDLNIDKQQSKVNRKTDIKCTKLDADKNYATNICNSKSESENMTHTDYSNSEKIQYSCDVCNFKTYIEKWMTHHTLLHKDKDVDSILVCDHCHYRTKVKQRLIKHMEKHMLLPYSCKICGYKCKFLYSLITHTRTHSEKAFSWPSDFVKHVHTHSNENPYSCDMCMYKCRKRSALSQHKRIHSIEKLYACKNYPFKSSIKNNLRHHTTVHTGKHGQHSASASHMQTYTKEKPYVCNICDYKAAQEIHLQRHLLRHSSDKLFQCQLCPYKSTCEAVLIEHMKGHTTEKPYWCQLCGYKCTRKNLLITHLNTHTSEEPFACTFCGYKSFLRGNLFLHMTVHGGVKPHKCDICDKKFSDKRCWTQHGVSCLRKHGFELKESLSAG